MHTHSSCISTLTSVMESDLVVRTSCWHPAHGLCEHHRPTDIHQGSWIDPAVSSCADVFNYRHICGHGGSVTHYGVLPLMRTFVKCVKQDGETTWERTVRQSAPLPASLPPAQADQFNTSVQVNRLGPSEAPKVPGLPERPSQCAGGGQRLHPSDFSLLK